MKNTYDLIIIGAGVAGCHLATLAAKNGMKVLILEKTKKTKKDSGIVSRKIEEFIPLAKGLIKYKIKKIKFFSPSGKTISLKSEEPFAYLLDREKFGKHMRKLAVQSGARIIYDECKVVDSGKQGVDIIAGGKKYSSKIVAGCDGTGSIVRRSMLIRGPQTFLGIISLGNTESRHTDIEVHFNKFNSPHFFSWLIPQSKEAGLIAKRDPVEHMGYFYKKIGFSPKKNYASPIPIGTVKSFSERSLLIGDSCGQVKPISGGGIMYSLECSAIAANVIKMAFDANDFSEGFLKKYEKQWKKSLSNDMRLQMICRKLYRKMSNEDIDDLFDIISNDIESIGNFDYDKISTIIWKLPKTTLLKCAFRYIPLIFEWSHD